MADPIKLDDAANTPASSPKINLGAPSGNIPAPNPSAPASSATGGGMGNIFTQSQAKKEESKMITSIISQKEVAQKTKSILGPAPTLEKSIEQEKEAALKRKLRLFQFVFVMLFVATAAMAFYFYTELSPDFTWFGENTTHRLTTTNESLKNVQTKINKDRYLSAQLKLNEFSYQADRFLSSVTKVNDPTINQFDKRAIFADLDESKKALPVLLGEIRSVLTQDIVIPTYRSEEEAEKTPEQTLQEAQDALRNALRDEKKAYSQTSTNPQDILDLKLIDNSVKLVGNTPLVNALQSTSQDSFQKQLDDYAQNPDPQKLKTLQDVIGKVLSSTKSDLATIADIKHNRIEWSTIISQISDVTSGLEGSNFNQPLLYDSLGGIVYNGYDFDTNSNKIVLSGTTKTFDGSNFTLMSNLIDHLENSVYFQDVDMRSFTKSKSGGGANEGYVANFKIDLRLETSGFSNKDTGINLQSGALKGSAATGTKRTAVPGSDSTQQQSAAAPSVPAPGAGVTQESPGAKTVASPSSSGSSGTQEAGSAAAPAVTTPSAASTQESSSPANK